jgi:anti-repressor protein
MSRKPEARAFKRWVTHTVLPQIRRTGAYQNQPARPDPANLSRKQLIYLALEAEEDAERLALENQQMRPYADLGERVVADDGTRTVAEAAQALGLGQNRLYQHLRDLGILIGHGERRNLPYQVHIDMGRMAVKETPFTDGQGRERIRRTTRVTGQGMGYIQKRLEGAGIIQPQGEAS